MTQMERRAEFWSLIGLLVLASCGRARSEATVNAARSARPSSVAVAQGSTDALRIPPEQTYEPRGLSPGERRPLLIFLHGLGSSGAAIFSGLRLAAFGAQERVFVIAPDGTLDSQRRRFWNAHPACCDFDGLRIDDVARFRRLLDTWSARPDVDPSRIYVMGHSNGGFMTQRLACAFGHRIAGAVSLAGAAPPENIECAPSKTLVLLEVHGDADPIVRYEGGSVFDTTFLPSFSSAQQGFSEWAKRFACTGAPKSGAQLDLDPSLPGKETRVQSFDACPGGTVALWTVHGGTHSVGSDPQSLAVIWRFVATARH
jgi:polyhydroxybutyrate depolymerase